MFALLMMVLQDPPPKDPHDKDVIITASRVVEDPKQVGSSASVVDGQDLARAQRRFVLDALREVPALDVVSSGSFGGTAAVFIRGASSDHTLLLIDGIEVHDAAATGRGFDVANLTTDQVDRIEVIRGPQSVLYGSDAIGGVIHVITPWGHGEPRFRFSAEGGSFATYRGSVSVAGGNERVNYALGGSRLRTGGFSAASDDLPGNDEDDGYRNATFSSKVGITPSNEFQMDLVVRHVDARTDTDNGGGAFQDDPNHTGDLSQWAYKIEPRLTLFDNFWEQALALKLTEVERNTDNLPDSASIEQVFSSFDSRIFDADWQHNFRVHPANIVTVGAEFEEDQARTSFASDGFFGPFFSEIRKVSAWTRGAYVQNRLHLADVFTATGGARVDDHEEFGTHATWRLTGALLVPNADTKLRGSVGTGFKAPSLFQLFSSFGDPTLDPEESLGWDAGVDQAFGGDVVVLSATYFKNRFDHLIDFDFVTSTYANIGRVETEGGEFAARIRPHEAVELAASYTVTETEDKATDEELVRRPRHKGSVRATVLPADAVTASLGVVYVGRRPENDFSTFPATRITLDDYWLGQAAVTVRPAKDVELFARVENLFDQEYEEANGFGVAGISAYAGVTVVY